MKRTVVQMNGMVGVVETHENRTKPQKLQLDSNVGIYACECQTAKSVYIGQSKNIPTRWRNHLMNLRRGSYMDTITQWQKDFDTFGEIEFRFQILQNADCHSLLDLETLWIKKYVAEGWYLYNNRLVTNDSNYIACPSSYADTIKKLIKLIDSGKVDIGQIEQAIYSFQ